MSETVTARISKWASELSYEDLTADAIREAKRYMLDSLGCALGGFQQHDVEIVLGVMDEIAGAGPATVIGTGKRLDVVSANTT